MLHCFRKAPNLMTMGGTQAQIPTPPPQPFEPCGVGCGCGGGSPWGSLGGPGAGRAEVWGTPTYIPQSNTLVVLTILNTHMWGF